MINKWDRAIEAGMTTERWVKYLLNSFESMRHVPIAIITAKDGRNIRKLVNLAQSVFKQANLRMTTGRLNKALRIAIERNSPPMRKNRRPKIYFASQIAGSPPTIVLKCNDSSLLDESWKRYLLGFLRESTPFREVPIRLVLRSRNETDPDLLSTAVEEDEPVEITELPEDQLDDGDVLGDAETDGMISSHILMIDDDEEFDEDFEEDPDFPAPNFVDDDDLV